MKKMNVLFFCAALMAGSLASAQDGQEQVKAFNNCVAQFLLAKFLPTSGGSVFDSKPEMTLAFIDGHSVDSPSARVAFLPGWEATSEVISSPDNQAMIRTRTEILTMANFRTESRLDMSYKHFSYGAYGVIGKPEDNIDVNLALWGFPALTADRILTENCQVDAWGRKTCKDSSVRFLNFQVQPVGQNMQSVLTWQNTKTGAETQFTVDNEGYLACLKAIH